MAFSVAAKPCDGHAQPSRTREPRPSQSSGEEDPGMRGERAQRPWLQPRHVGGAAGQPAERAGANTRSKQVERARVGA